MKFTPRHVGFTCCLFIVSAVSSRGDEHPGLRDEALRAARTAATYYREQVASQGGYVYYYSLDLQQRWGEGPATQTQIWVQPPGTPTVGMALLRMYEASGESLYLDAATAAGEALIYGQLKSGGWTNLVDFDRRGRVALYRNGRGGGKNYSSLDDGQTQSALQFLIQLDAAHKSSHAAVREATRIALDALLAAQYPNGAFPQVWKGPVAPQPVRKAAYPDYDWKTEGRVKNYWDMYTLNDNVCGYVADTLTLAAGTYQDPRYLDALRRLGDFLLLAQLPEPQPAWAQQYDYAMRPIWARAFEPPALASDESQEAMLTLLAIYRATGDDKYLAPIPHALHYLSHCRLLDGQLARYYELQSNRPLYMQRRGKAYQLTYDDSRLPDHYGWKIQPQLDEIRQQYDQARLGRRPEDSPTQKQLEGQVRRTVDSLDAQGRWIDTYQGDRLVGQPSFQPGQQFISSATFSRHLGVLADYLQRTKGMVQE